MNVLQFLLENLSRGPVTLRFPERPPAPAAYRGLVEMDRERCEGCGMCAFVCTSRAIVFRNKPQTYEWSYDPGQCTFCGRCVDACASHALRQQPSRPPIYTDPSELRLAYSLPRKPPPGAKGGAR
ncbi:MAG TPA: 4Fe-4S binding protein [Anaeromyxobacter sp.]|nr:4Fe-4S binding protein [Anaeromyxobacter sp.]